MFRFHILGLLRKGDACHGYALMKEYNRRTGRNYGAGYFYRQLGELMGEGLVRSAPNPMGADARRTPYQITDAGLDAFDRWFEDIPREPLETDMDQVARALFFSDVDTEMRRRVLESWKSDLMDKAKALQRDLSRARSLRQDSADIRPALIHRDLFRAAADLEFLEELDRTLASKREEKAAEPPAAVARSKRSTRTRRAIASA